MRHLNARGRAVGPRNPHRLVWRGLCTYWTDDHDQVDVPEGGDRPHCPECASPMGAVTAREFFAEADEFEAAGHPGWRAFVESRKQECHRQGMWFTLYEVNRAT